MTLEGNGSPIDGSPIDRRSGLLPAGQPLTDACRAFLRDGLSGEGVHQDHVSLCAFCSARLAAKRRLAVALGVSGSLPAEMRSVAFLDQIRVRIVHQSERSALGAMLDKGMPVVVPAAVDQAFPSDLLDTDLARRTVGGESVSAPEPAASAAWARIRNNVLREVAQPGIRRIEGTKVGLSRTVGFSRTKVVTLAGAVAAAVICVMLVADGTSTAPTIVITDVSAMPSVEFSPMAVIRHGSNLGGAGH